MFLMHPKDVKTKPGLNVEFLVKTATTVKTYSWYFQEKIISNKEKDYTGTATDKLTIDECLSKHRGVYKCMVTNKLGETFISERATLIIGIHVCNWITRMHHHH